MDLQKEEAIWAQRLDDTSAKGREEGILIGQEKGRQEGRKVEKIEVAKNLLKAGVSVDLIIQSTGLTADEVKDLI